MTEKPGKKTLDQYPDSDPRSLGYHVSQTALSALSSSIPGAGYAVNQLIAQLVGEPVQRRRAEWFNSLANALNELSEKVECFDPARLGEDEDFVSIVMEITPLALKTHREGKRRAFQNAVVNVALGRTIEDVLKGRFLQCLDQFSEEHIVVLKILQDPMSYPRVAKAAGGILAGSQITALKPELDAQGLSDAVQSVVFADLQQERLIQGSLNALGSGASLGSKNSTELGDAFLRFIEDPSEDS